MTFSEIPVPEVYRESADFRFFLKWIELCLTDIQYKTDNLIDLLDPQRCPTNLLWMLGDTCGYKYDERASVAFNRLVIMHFAKLIRYRGSKVGMTLAAELNLDQFHLDERAKENEALADRLEDTSIPVNSVYVSQDVDLGYIDIVYFSENVPKDICIEYVRPLGMYCFKHAGVAVNARTKVSVDARLTNLNDGNLRPGPAFIGHYRRSDYASLQQGYISEYTDEHGDVRRREFNPTTERYPVYNRNSKYEQTPTTGMIDPGFRSLYSLQLCNNEHIVKALLPSMEAPEKIFSLGYGPQDAYIKYKANLVNRQRDNVQTEDNVNILATRSGRISQMNMEEGEQYLPEIETVYPPNYLKNMEGRNYNLRIDREYEESLTPRVYTVESADAVSSPRPAVNPPMAVMGDAISLNSMNRTYTQYDPESGTITEIAVEDSDSNND